MTLPQQFSLRRFVVEALPIKGLHQKLFGSGNAVTSN